MSTEQCIIPEHVAVIMDGNGRWAKQRGLDRSEGHIKGVESMRDMMRYSVNKGIKYLTVYAFSKENWSRPSDEVNCLMELFCKTISMELPSLNEMNIRTIFLSEKGKLSKELIANLEKCEKETASNDGMTFLVALNYSSKSEIINAVKELALEVKNEKTDINDIDEKYFSSFLMTRNIPDPDLLIRTSGEQRLSNFMLWQLSYTELYFSDKLWPDFDNTEYQKALDNYASRSRRFGKAE